jgi:hypothetical protein
LLRPFHDPRATVELTLLSDLHQRRSAGRSDAPRASARQASRAGSVREQMSGIDRHEDGGCVSESWTTVC